MKYLRVGARGERARVVFACDCSVFGRVERHRKEYLVAFHGAQQRRNRCTQHTEKRGRSKENLHETIIFFFRRCVERNSSSRYEIVKIVVSRTATFGR